MFTLQILLAVRRVLLARMAFTLCSFNFAGHVEPVQLRPHLVVDQKYFTASHLQNLGGKGLKGNQVMWQA